MNWLMIALGAIPALVLSLGIHTAYMDWFVTPGQKAALEAQSKTLTEQCAKDKQISEEASHAYQDRLAALSSQLNTLRLHRPTRCIVPTTHAASRPDGSPKPLQLLGPYGLSTDFLYDFAGEGEKYRLQLIGLQSFINQTWKAYAN